MRAIQMTLFSILLFSSYACNQSEQKSRETPSNKFVSTKGQLIAFLNPNGSPCQMQEEVLGRILNTISDKVDVKRVYTTNEGDISYFYQYGIRALPSLILLNSRGEEVKRFAPGIKEEDEITTAINNCKC